jgi:hypothetical protein
MKRQRGRSLHVSLLERMVRHSNLETRNQKPESRKQKAEMSSRFFFLVSGFWFLVSSSGFFFWFLISSLALVASLTGLSRPRRTARRV